MAENTGTIVTKIIMDTTQVATANKDLTEIKGILTDIASNTKGALANEFKSMGAEADKVVKKISAIKTVEQELEAQISRTKRAYQLANDTDAVDKLAARRKISQEKAQSIYDNALESRSAKLQTTSKKIMDGEIALGKTYAKNIGLLEQTKRLLENTGKNTGDITEYTKGLKVDQKAFNATTAIPKDPKAETLNSSQYTDGIKQAKQNILALDRQIFEQLQKNNGAETQRTSELRNQKAVLESQIGALKAPKVAADIVSPSYVQQISALRQQAQQAHAEFKAGTKTLAEYRAEYMRLNVKAVGLGQWARESNVEIGQLGKVFTGMNNNMEYFFAKFRSHVSWILSGGAIAMLAGIPTMMTSRIKDMEVGMAGYRQVMQPIEHDITAVNKEAQRFITIAGNYGESVDKIIDAGRSWGRMYKDVAVVNYLVSQSAKMAAADNFSVSESVKGIESAMAQFGMRSEKFIDIQMNSNRVVDVITKVAHTGAASAQDLTGAIERAGSSAHQAGVSFEFFNALVSTGVRNTARSGAEIGQSLKSMFSSIHSNKAIDEIEKLGISVYKFNEDGTKSFREVQDVILDLSFAISNTTKDTSKLELALGGGKWQVSKITAIMTDYKEIVKMWENAVSSTGFTNEQVGIQMETLSRKSATLKAELDRVFNTVGNNGLADTLKGATTSMTNFVIGVNAASEGIFVMLKWSAIAGVGIYTLATAMQGLAYWSSFSGTATRLANGATLQTIQTDSLAATTKMGLVNAYKSQAAAAGMAAAASGTVSRGTAALSAISMGWVGIALITVATVYSLVSSYGEYTKSLEKNADTLETRNAKAVDALNMDQQRASFVDTLSKKYNELSDSIAANSEDVVGNTKKTEQQNFIIEALAKQTGLTTEQLVKDGKIQVGVVDDILKARREETKEKIEQDIAKTLSEYNATMDSLRLTSDRIDTMKEEMKAVGLLGQALQWLNSIRAQGILSEAAKVRAEANTPLTDESSWNGMGNDVTREIKGNIVTPERQLAYAEELEATGNKMLSESGQAGIDVLLGQATQLKVKSVELLTGIQSTQAKLDALNKEKEPPKTVETDEDGDGKGSSAGGAGSSGSAMPRDPSRVIARDAYKDAVTIGLHRAKIATDEYNASLDTLNTTEKIQGKTADTVVNRLELLSKRWKALDTQAQYSKSNADSTGALLNAKIAENATMVGITKEAWQALTPLQQEELKAQYKDVLESHKDTEALYKAHYAHLEALSKANLEKTKVHNDAEEIRTPYKPEELESRRLSRNKTTEEILVAQNTNKFDGNNDRTLNAIHYKARLEDAKVYDDALLRLKGDLEKAKKKLDDEATDGNKDALQKIVDQTQDAYDKTLLAATNNANDIKNLEYSKNAKIKEGLAGIIDDVVVKGGSLKEIWGNLWNQLASSAIKALLQVQSTGGGLLESVFGMLGGGGMGGGGNPVAQTAGQLSKMIAAGAANGGLADKPRIYGEAGLEMAIPLTPGKRSRALELYEQTGQMLGVGTKVVPSISPRTQQIAQEANNNREELAELKESNALLRSLCNIMLNKEMGGGGQGNTQVAVLPTTQGDGELWAQINRMRSTGYKV